MLNIHYAKKRSGTIKSKQLQGKLSAVLLNAQKRILKRLEQYVATWNHKPFFETKGGVHYAGGNISAGVSTDDQVFWWLELGTDTRYAVMTPDFVSKTAPGRVVSQQGQGGFAYLSKNPKPGIEARNVRVTIAALEEFQFRNDVMTVAMDIDFLDFGAEENILG
jgi:hypothetical protein